MSEIVFENVGHSFGERTVLQQINLRLSEQRIGIVGANGSGKSTLARMINGLVVPTEGHVHVNGLDTAKKGRDVRKQVGFVFTDPNHQIVMPTVAEDIEISLRRSGSGKTERAAKVASVLERYGLAGHADHPTHQLSGGQKQLVGLAQSLIRRPELLLLDEPLSALDLNYQFHVMDLVRRETRLRNIVTVVVVHDINIALRHADHALMLKDGNLLADGEPSQVITPETLAQVYGVRGRIEHCSRGMPQVMIDGLAETLV